MKLTKDQVTAMIQCMLDISLESNDKRLDFLDSQFPMVETEDGWDIEFEYFVGPTKRYHLPSRNHLKLHITAHQRIDSYDEDEGPVEGVYENV